MPIKFIPLPLWGLHGIIDRFSNHQEKPDNCDPQRSSFQILEVCEVMPKCQSSNLRQANEKFQVNRI